MSVGILTGIASGGGWRACRELLPEAVRRIRVREPIVKRFFIFSGLLFGFGLLGLTSYRVRELIAALVLFSVVFGALFLMAVFYVLVDSVAREVAIGLRIRAPQWNRVGRDWMLGFAHSLQGRHLWQRWTHRVSTTAVQFTDAD